MARCRLAPSACSTAAPRSTRRRRGRPRWQSRHEKRAPSVHPIPGGGRLSRCVCRPMAPLAPPRAASGRTRRARRRSDLDPIAARAHACPDTPHVIDSRPPARRGRRASARPRARSPGRAGSTRSPPVARRRQRRPPRRQRCGLRRRRSRPRPRPRLRRCPTSNLPIQTLRRRASRDRAAWPGRLAVLGSGRVRGRRGVTSLASDARGGADERRTGEVVVSARSSARPVGPVSRARRASSAAPSSQARRSTPRPGRSRSAAARAARTAPDRAGS